MKTFVKEITWLGEIDTGWGNGYVLIPEGHILFGEHYDVINESVDVHGGLTFSNSSENVDFVDCEGYWVIGFDTAHYDDTLEKWPKHRVEEETERLANQLRGIDKSTKRIYCK